MGFSGFYPLVIKYGSGKFLWIARFTDWFSYNKIWLVVWSMTFMCPYIGGFVIPTDSYFSEGVKPPISQVFFVPSKNKKKGLILEKRWKKDKKRRFDHGSGDERCENPGTITGNGFFCGYLQGRQARKIAVDHQKWGLPLGCGSWGAFSWDSQIIWQPVVTAVAHEESGKPKLTGHDGCFPSSYLLCLDSSLPQGNNHSRLCYWSLSQCACRWSLFRKSTPLNSRVTRVTINHKVVLQFVR